jgi:hypothetical protein
MPSERPPLRSRVTVDAVGPSYAAYSSRSSSCVGPVVAAAARAFSGEVTSENATTVRERERGEGGGD